MGESVNSAAMRSPKFPVSLNGATHDLGPLAWVLDELRRTLQTATASLRTFVLHTKPHGPGAATASDAVDLHQARKQLNQGASALEMVAQQEPAKILHALETWVQNVERRPEIGTEDGVEIAERACRALLDFLDGLLKGSTASPVALFPQYRALLELIGVSRIHPADLWPQPWYWQEVLLPANTTTLQYGPSTRADLGHALLPILKTLDSGYALPMAALCAGLAAGDPSLQARIFWALAAGFFEAMAAGRLPDDVLVRRTAAQALAYYGALSGGQVEGLEGAARDFLFYCALARPAASDGTPLLGAVCRAYGVDPSYVLEYQALRFGRFDPAQLAALRKHVGAAAQAWSVLAGGDLRQAEAAMVQFAAVGEAVLHLHPENIALVNALKAVVDATVDSGCAPTATVALEVATSILYLEVAYEDVELASQSLQERSACLAARLKRVYDGAELEPVEHWMEALYRQAGERETLGSVVVELRQSLAALESALDTYMRHPADLTALAPLPAGLGHLQGVFSLLGFEQAAAAAFHMRALADQLLTLAEPQSLPLDEPTLPAIRLVNSLSAMGFLIDMLRYQPAMAKELFVYDALQGEFRLALDREPASAQAAAGLSPTNAAHRPVAVGINETTLQFDALQRGAVDVSATLERGLSTPLKETNSALEDEIQSIFLAEAREVVRQAQVAVVALHPSLADATTLTTLTTLRRAFHTLKGSARMVGLSEFGETAWSFEQLLNGCLAQRRPTTESLRTLCQSVLVVLEAWIDCIALGQPAPVAAGVLRQDADHLRLQSHHVEHEVSSAPAEGLGPAPLRAATATPSQYLGAAEIAAEPMAPARVIAIGELRLKLDFFELFINEADAWVRQLQFDINQWDIGLQPVPPQGLMALAHSLQGSAATVGFGSFSVLARALEQAVEHLTQHRAASAEHRRVLADAAQEMGRLLDAFATGNLLAAQESVVQALHKLRKADAAQHPAGAQDAKQMDGQRGFSQSKASSGLNPNSTASESTPDQQTGQDVTLATLGTPALAHAAAWKPPLEHDEDLDSQDFLDKDLLPVFLEEGQELLSAMGAGMRQWAEQPEQLDSRAQVLRVLHTLKGSARLAGALRLGELAHRMESAIEKLGTSALLQASELAPCVRYLEQLHAQFDELVALDTGSLADTRPSLPSQARSALPDVGPQAPRAPLPYAVAQWTSRPAGSQSVKVRAHRLDRLIDQAGEVMIGRSRTDTRLGHIRGGLGELGRSLERLRHQLRDLELQAELQMQSRQADASEISPLFDPLEFDRFTRVQEVSRMMVEALADVDTVHKNLYQALEGAQEDLVAQGRRAMTLQKELLTLRLVDFEKISDRLYGVVRQASKDASKPARLDILGSHIEVDRGMLDRMTPAFEHLLRNAVAHGIESAEARLLAGKPATGAIAIEVDQDGSDVSVTFSDDGAGLHVEKIRERAVASGLLEPKQTLNDEDAARFLFIPGFSTAEQVTELSGRGIGLDVVLADVSAVGGRIETTSQPGRGTRFKVVFPLTTAVTQVVMLRIGPLTIGVPATLLETVLQLSASGLATAYADAVLSYGDLPAVPFYWAGALLNASARSQEATARRHAVAVIRSAGQRVAVHVDEVLGSREVVVKNMGPQLSLLPGLAGMSVLASGAVVLIYNPVALASLYGVAARQAQTAAPGDFALGMPQAPLNAQAPLVLVVDDSITVRRVTQRLLLREGYRVALATDGLQALELLQDELPALVLLDIEMPRMDGLELARNIRSAPALAGLPLVVITSRIASKHRDQAFALGVNHYLGKPYSDVELLALVGSYCQTPEPVSTFGE